MTTPLTTLSQGIEDIKLLIEDVVREKGAKGKNSLITSSKTINVLHEVVKSELILNGVNPHLINPPLGISSPEVQLAGFLKFKTQDVCVFPNHIHPNPELLLFSGLHSGKKDPYGELYSEHILTINLRSQLSSLSKNKDTMYERTYAEPMNLHRRLPKMVLGEVYLLSARELASEAVAKYEVKYKPTSASIARVLQEYIFGFSALNLRTSQGDDFFKYERVALIIADFEQNPVKIYETAGELVADGLLPNESTASLSGMTFNSDFIPDLLNIYAKRFGAGKLS